MNQHCLALIDSGVGGLTLVKAVKHRFPAINIIYANDNVNIPYGPKPEQEVVSCVINFVTKLHAAKSFDALVVGCNTASTVALPSLRELLPSPIIGVVPAIKPAAAMTKTGHIGLLATEGTVRRQYTKDLIQNFAAGCSVHLLGSNELVQMAERKLRGQKPDLDRLREILRPLTINSVDVVVLGCTHFPLLTEELAVVLGTDCTIIDSGDAIARRVGQVLGLDALNLISHPGELTAYFSEDSEELSSLRPYLSDFGFRSIHVLG